MRVFLAASMAVNILLCVLLVPSFWTGSRSGPGWDGPALVSAMLGAATLVLTGVAVLAAILSIWGFATLREHAGSIAEAAALKAMPQAAEAAAERAVRKILELPEGDTSNEIARAYGEEGHDV